MAAPALPVPPDLSVPFRPQGLKRRYGMALRFSEGDRTTKTHYEADVACPAATAAAFRLEVQKHQVYINDELPERVMDLLADACGKTLYPIVFEGGGGTTLRRLANGAEIRSRWAAAVPALQDYYTGPVADGILDAMSRAVSNEIRLFDTLRQDWLPVLLVAPIFQTYKNHRAQADFYLPVVSYKLPVRYRVDLTVLPEHSPSGLLVIDCQGSCTDPRPVQDIVRGHAVPVSHPEGGGAPARGAVNLRFKVHPGNGTLFSAEGACSLFLPDGTERSIGIELFQLDGLEAAPAPVRSSGTSLLLESEDDPIPKKSGWRALFG